MKHFPSKKPGAACEGGAAAALALRNQSRAPAPEQRQWQGRRRDQPAEPRGPRPAGRGAVGRPAPERPRTRVTLVRDRIQG